MSAAMSADRAAADAADPPRLVCEALTVPRPGPGGARGRPRLDGVGFAVAGPAWISVVGPNGAGKSSLLRALAGLLPAGGRVLLEGRDRDQWPARERARRLAWLGQGGEGDDGESGEGAGGMAGLAPWRADEVTMLGRLPWRPWLGPPGPADRRAVRSALEAMDVWHLRGRRLGELSGGERQRVLLARALAVEAGVLLLDEPLASLDPPHQADCLAAIRDRVAAGAVVITVLHELSLALLSDRVLVLAGGRLVHDGDPRHAATQAAVCEVFDQRIEVVADADGLPWVRLRVEPRPDRARADGS